MKTFYSLIFLIVPISFVGQTTDFEFFYSSRTESIPSLYISSENLFINDMVVDPPQSIRIKLSKDDRREILNKINEIKFFEYPSIYKFESAEPSDFIVSAIPCSHKSITVFINGKMKEVNWNTCSSLGKSKDNKYEKLQQLELVITKILFTKPAYQKSKKPRAMRL